MARIPAEEIERSKRKTALAAHVQVRGVLLRRHDPDLVGIFPVHQAREPSLMLTRGKGLSHCLGACRRRKRNTRGVLA